MQAYKLNTYFKDRPTVQKKQKMKTNAQAQLIGARQNITTIYRLTTNWYDNQIPKINKAQKW